MASEASAAQRLSAAFTRRVDPVGKTAIVAVGDVLLISLFVGIGEVQHGFPPWEYPGRMVGTLVPFLVGWFVAAFVGGLYTRDAWDFPIRAVSWTIPAWIAAVLIAMALRATPVFHGGAALTFGLVAMGIGTVLLVPWRVALSVLAS